MGRPQRRFIRLRVLILVLVEHTLRDDADEVFVFTLKSLNPCFSGTYSQRAALLQRRCSTVSLNPCFSGTYSQRQPHKFNLVKKKSLNPCFSGTYSQSLCGRCCDEG